MRRLLTNEGIKTAYIYLRAQWSG